MSKIYKRASYILTLVTVLLYVLTVVYLFGEHTLFEEWDGVLQLWAGEALMRGEGYIGWPSKFWPPLYSALTGILATLVSGHTAGKLVSFVASMGLLIVAYWMCRALKCSRLHSMLGPLIMASAPLFGRSAIQAENHALDALFFVTSIFFLLRYATHEHKRSAALAGGSAALAAMTRYTSYVLPLSAIIFLSALALYNESHKRKKYLKDTFFYLFCFSAMSAPWWILNTLQNGSPLHNWNYLNIASEAYPGSSFEFWWTKQTTVSSTVDTFALYTNGYIQNFTSNLRESGEIITNVGSMGLSAFTSVIGVLYLFIIRRKQSVIILFAFAIYVVVVSQAKVFGAVFLPWTSIFACTTAKMASDYMSYLQSENNLITSRIAGVSVYLAAAVLIVLSVREIYAYTQDNTDSGQLVCKDGINNILSNVEEKYIMSIHPSRAYYSNSKWLMMPLYYEKDLTNMINYRGLSNKVVSYAPKKPLSTKSQSISADYIIYDLAAKKRLPQFSYLLNPSSNKIPESMNLVYSCESASVYEINKQ